MNAHIKTILHHHLYDPARLLNILHALQNKWGYLPDEIVNETAGLLSIPVSHIQGVIDFYSFFHSQPVAQYQILLSNCIIDINQGQRHVKELFCQQLNMAIDQPREDGLVSLAETSCTGLCDQGPAALINGVAIPALNEKRINTIVKLIKEQRPLNDWPLALFQINDNIYKPDFLLNNPLTAGSAITTLLSQGADKTLSDIEQSGLRGRGGAGFATASKWRFCRQAIADEHFVVCNADEGEPGTFKDRLLLNKFADQLFEGMTVCARIIGAQRGFVYLRAEYLFLLEKLERTLTQRREDKLLGQRISGIDGFDFDIEIRLGAGAYICGEESALLESLEGKRGIPRIRPPFPVTHGYLGKPTVVNNVETFIAAAKITADGHKSFQQLGTAQSSGTRLLSISGDCSKPGIYEYPFGTSITTILDDCQASDTSFVQIGGPSGTMVDKNSFQRTICFEDLPTGGSFMIFNHSRDPLETALNFSHFFAHESCGFCTPCRVGTSLIKKLLDKINNGLGSQQDILELDKLCHLIQQNSHCGLGQTATNPVRDTLNIFDDVYKTRINNRKFSADFDLEASLQEARQLTQRDDPAAHLEQFDS